jgi:hypothetical protein
MKWLLVILGLAVTAFLLVDRAFGLLPDRTQDQEVGKWLLMLATGVITAGVIVAAFRFLEHRQDQRAAWRSRLADLTSAHDAVLTARLRLAAHQTAKAYSDEIAGLVTVRETLRRAFPRGEAKKTRGEVTKMWAYLEDLGNEYRDNYLEVSRRQRIDEAKLKKKTDQLVASNDDPPDWFLKPMSAYQLIADEEKFPHCHAFLDDKLFKNCKFETGYRNARKLALRRLSMPARIGGWTRGVFPWKKEAETP